MLIKNIQVCSGLHQPRQIKNVLVNNQGEIKFFDKENELDLTNANDLLKFDAKQNLIFLPGLLDTHIHGYGGGDFSEVGDQPELLPKILQALGEAGIAYVMPTLVSLSLPVLKKCLQEINAYYQKNQAKGQAKIVGIHLEGPFIAKNCKGAHAATVLQERIDLAMVKDIFAAAPAINEWKITLAPDLPGAITFMQQVKSLQAQDIACHVFLGHTNPEQKYIDEAILAGAKGFTHLGNACGERCCRLTHQLEKEELSSELVKWVMTNPAQCPHGVELITDGIHLSESFVQLLRKQIATKIMLVSDALGPSGLNDGIYQLGTLKIQKKGKAFYLLEKQGVLAGGASSLIDCMQQYANWLKQDGLTLDERIHNLYAALIENPRLSSLSPLAAKQLPDHCNFVLVDQAGGLRASLCNGQLRFHDEHKRN